MLLYLFQWLFPDHLVTNLFHYISFRSVLAAFTSFASVVFLMPYLIQALRAKSIRQIVRDDGPKTHSTKVGTPTMGGLIMVVGVFLSSVLFCRLDNQEIWISLFVLLTFGAVGFWDDYLKLTKKNTKGVSSRMKMLSLGILSCIAVAGTLHYLQLDPRIDLPFLKKDSLYLDFTFLFYVWGFIVLTGSSNAVNLTDGLDGLAIVPIMTTAFVLLVTSYITGHAVFSGYLQFPHMAGAGELSVVMASVIGVGLGFLWYNAHPAEVFMGDVGSLSLGGLLGAVALITHKEFILFIAGFLFVIEAVSVMIQVGYYKTKKKRIFRMAPIHHHFELGGWPESKVIVRFWILSILFALVALSTLKVR